MAAAPDPGGRRRDAAARRPALRGDAVAPEARQGAARRPRSALRHHVPAHGDPARVRGQHDGDARDRRRRDPCTGRRSRRSRVRDRDRARVGPRAHPVRAGDTRLRPICPLAIETRSKAARGYALLSAGGAEAGPRRGRSAGTKATTAEALAAMLTSCARQIEANADGVVAKTDPEWIHQMRIGTRRLRACFALMRDIVPLDTLEPLRAEARWLARALGHARDLDVLVEETLPTIAAAVRSAGGSAATLRGAAGARRAASHRARTAARAAVASPRFVQLLLAVGALAARPRFGVDASAAAAATLALPARRFARPVLGRRQRKLLRRGANLPAAPPAARHAARLAAKQLRYATEFFAALFPRRRTRAYRAALARLQEILGTLNDAAVAAELAARVAGPEAPATATLQGWAAAQSAARAEALGAAWQDFSRARPFWAARLTTARDAHARIRRSRPSSHQVRVRAPGAAAARGAAQCPVRPGAGQAPRDPDDHHRRRRRRPQRDREQADRMDGSAPHPRHRVRTARRGGARAAAGVALLARAAAARAHRDLLERVVHRNGHGAAHRPARQDRASSSTCRRRARTSGCSSTRASCCSSSGSTCRSRRAAHAARGAQEGRPPHAGN